jgi:nicotinamidase-related amidase
MPGELKINIQKAAIVVIDLQKGITSVQTEPHSSKVVIENTVKILNAARRKNMPVFLVHVTPSPDLKDALHPVSETTFQSRGYDPSWSEYVPELNIQPSDFLITKHQWGAFYGTELDLQLRRRGIDTIILCGISTNFGVESTARFAYEFGFNQIFVSDAMAARSKEEHDNSIKYIFPRLGLIRTTDEILNVLIQS